MAGYLVEDTRKVTTHRLIEMKQQGKKIAMLTSYDYTMARIVDGAGVDVILIGDSASNVMAGNTTTLPITLNQMIYHATSVMHGVERALVVCDMPFGSYQVNPTEGVTNAIRIMKESHADALKLEGGEEIIGTVKRILSAGIPIMGHLGLMPQSINKYGTYTVRAKDDSEAEKLIRDAHLLEEAGCFAIVLEKIPAALAERVASELTIPIIGIGAGGGVDGDTSLERLDDVTFKIIIVLGDDTDADLSGELVNEVVQNETAEVSGQGSDDHGLEIVGKVGACDGHKTSDDDGFSEVHMEIFVHDFRDNVETAGRSVRVKEDSLSVADHDDHGDHIHSDISGRGYRTREQKLEHEEKRRQQDGDKDDLCPEGLIHEEECQDDADDV